jgi:hypothetical protein
VQRFNRIRFPGIRRSPSSGVGGKFQQLLMKRQLAWMMTAGLAVVSAHAATNAPAPVTDFGFSGKEVYPIDNYTSLLQAADLNGDGKTDLILANNSRSKLNLLINRTGETNPPAAKPAMKRELNELPPDARFRIESIASEKRIAALVVTDLNNDLRPDLAYYGEPRELIVQYNEGTNGWGLPKRWPIEDGQLTVNALGAGDLNGDTRTDLVLLAEKHVYLLAQTKDGTLGEPRKIPVSIAARAAQVMDVNGDGRQDLLLVNWESATPFRFRLQNGSGELEPEVYFKFSPIRSYIADNLVKGAGTQVITVAQNSGRAQISHFVQKPAPELATPFREGQFQVLPLASTDRVRRGVLWADVNGDRRADLLVAEPESGQLSFYEQQTNGTLAPPHTFPTLAGVSDITAADWDADGRNDVFLFSPDEKQIGTARLDDKGRLPFPTLLTFEGKPLVMAVDAPKPGVPPVLAVIVDRDGKRSLVTRSAKGDARTQKLAESFKSNPTVMQWHDVNQDGLADLVILIPYEKIKVLLQVADKDFEEVDVAPPGGTVEQPWLASADVDGDSKAELLLPQKNFLRAVVLKRGVTNNADVKPGWSFLVRDQINGAASNSRITGAATIPTTNGSALFLLDAERKALTLTQRDAAGVWQSIRNVTLPVAVFNSLQAVGLGAPKPNTVSLVGLNSVAWLPLSGMTWELEELDGYETPIKDGYLHDVIPGDLNQDGRRDLVFLETGKHYLDLVIFDAANHLVPANRWQVFEERSFRGTRADLPEPREAVVADVTGDGKNDLIVLVHDRVLVYAQE